MKFSAKKPLAVVAAAAAITLPLTQVSGAAFLIEIDTDGADDGPITYSPNFSFGGDTTRQMKAEQNRGRSERTRR